MQEVSFLLPPITSILTMLCLQIPILLPHIAMITRHLGDEMTIILLDMRTVMTHRDTERETGTGKETETATDGIEIQRNHPTTGARIVIADGIMVHPVVPNIVQVEENIRLVEITVLAEVMEMITPLLEIGNLDMTAEEVARVATMGLEVGEDMEDMEDGIGSEALLRNDFEALPQI